MRKRCHLFRYVLFIAFVCASALARPFKSSFAEADYRAETGRLEISIRLFIDDTEEMLTKRAGKPISFDKTPAAELDALLFASVQTAFIVKAPAGAPVSLRWIGRELNDREQHLWLYVECEMPGGIAGARFAHRMLKDTFSDQLNSIRVRDLGPPMRQATLLFPDDKERVVFAKKK